MHPKLDIRFRFVEGLSAPPSNTHVLRYKLSKGWFDLEEPSRSFLRDSIMPEVALNFHEGENKPIVDFVPHRFLIDHL